MNWQLFSTVGYISVGLWLGMPLVWLLHEVWRPRRWLVHVALLMGLAAFVLATINSRAYVNNIQVDRTEQIEEQMARQRAIEAERMKDVARISFAEDAAGDRLDKAGMDDADLAYFESIADDTPEWKRQKKQRSTDAADDTEDLEAMIDGGAPEAEGLESKALEAEQPVEPIYMSDADKLAADRLDAANLMGVRIMLVLAAAFCVVDYFRRLNNPREAYFPLPVPSRWADAVTPRPTVDMHPSRPDCSLLDELRRITRRGEMFVCVTSDARTACAAATRMGRLPVGLWPMQVVRVSEEPELTDADIFETLWYGRHSFVIDSTERAESLLAAFLKHLADRRETRARVRQTVHVIWDIDTPVSPPQRQAFARLGQATGFRLLLRRETLLAS